MSDDPIVIALLPFVQGSLANLSHEIFAFVAIDTPEHRPKSCEKCLLKEDPIVLDRGIEAGMPPKSISHEARRGEVEDPLLISDFAVGQSSLADVVDKVFCFDPINTTKYKSRF